MAQRARSPSRRRSPAPGASRSSTARPSAGQALADLIDERTPAAARYLPWEPALHVPHGTGVLINATSIGFHPDEASTPDVDLETLVPGMVVADVVANPPRTRFLAAAEERGCTTLDGLGMLVNQALIAVRLWTGPGRQRRRHARRARGPVQRLSARPAGGWLDGASTTDVRIPMDVPGYAAPSAKAPLEPFLVPRRDLGPHDVGIDIKYSGICHSDIHQAREEWFTSIFPMVPGHEIAGIVSGVGSEVTRYQVGDRVGVGLQRRVLRRVRQLPARASSPTAPRVPLPPTTATRRTA